MATMTDAVALTVLGGPVRGFAKYRSHSSLAWKRAAFVSFSKGPMSLCECSVLDLHMFIRFYGMPDDLEASVTKILCIIDKYVLSLFTPSFNCRPVSWSESQRRGCFSSPTVRLVKMEAASSFFCPFIAK